MTNVVGAEAGVSAVDISANLVRSTSPAVKSKADNVPLLTLLG
jgi:hypothetical protein